MLSREHRLPATTTLSHAHYIKTKLYSVKWVKNTQQVSRFAFLVRKSVDKRAVIRNRIRRLFRSCVEELLPNIVSGYDMLFFLEKGIIDEQREELYKELKDFFQRKQLIQ